MHPKHSFSDSFSINTRKYFLGPVFILVGSLLLIYTGKIGMIIGAVLLAIGIFFLLLRKIEFDDQFIYIGSRKFTFSQLKELSSFDINQHGFPYLVFSDNGRKRRYVTDAGQAGLLRIAIGIIFPSLDPHKNIKRFIQLYKDSRNESKLV